MVQGKTISQIDQKRGYKIRKICPVCKKKFAVKTIARRYCEECIKKNDR